MAINNTDSHYNIPFLLARILTHPACVFEFAASQMYKTIPKYIANMKQTIAVLEVFCINKNHSQIRFWQREIRENKNKN